MKHSSPYSRRDFLLSSSASLAALALSAQAKGFETDASSVKVTKANQWLYSNTEFAHTRYLNEHTHDLARKMLSGQWGRTMAVADFTLPAGATELSPNKQYAEAAKLAAKKAPIWIHPHCLVVGSATLLEARHHLVPLMWKLRSTSHTTIGFDKVLRIGYKGLRAKIIERLERGGLDVDGVDLLNAMLGCLDAANIWHRRYLAELDKRIAGSTGQERENYIITRDALANVPENPPQTFHEAVQSLRFAFVFQKLMGNWSGLGRVDEMLGSYLERDLARGTITLDQAREILAHFWILGAEWTTGIECGSGDAQHYQNVILAGIDENGREVTNDVTYLILDIVGELHISDFPIAVRINRHSSKKLLQRVAQVQRFGGGIVALYNEETVIKGLVDFGYEEKIARRFTNDGCWEVLIPGESAFLYFPMDILQIMQKSFGENKDDILSDDLSFEDVYARFCQELENVQNAFSHRAQRYWLSKDPCPLVSILVDDCIERGLAYNNRGPRYSIYAPHMGGLADVADSLTALKRLVYEQNVITLSQFSEIIKNNWRSRENLRRMVLNRITGYGNDNDKADAMMIRVYNDYTRIFSQKRDTQGVLMPPGISTFGREIAWAPKRHATFSGHLAGDVLATNLSPSPGCDKKGPTAVINSYTKLDLSRTPNGATLELKLHPASVKGTQGIDAMVSLMRVFQKRGGWYVHMDVVDSALLIDAQLHPEKYHNLPVRIAGWSARFATLNRDWQNMVIARTQQYI